MARLTAMFLAAALAAGCGGGSGGPAGVSGTKQISAVNDTEKASLCDWFVGMVGGYGAAPTCQDGFIEAPATKAECTSTFPSCAVTVAQFQSCIETIVAAQDTCTQQSLAGAMADADCQAVGLAGCFD
jgi:hypothetical protein